MLLRGLQAGFQVCAASDQPQKDRPKTGQRRKQRTRVPAALEESLACGSPWRPQRGSQAGAADAWHLNARFSHPSNETNFNRKELFDIASKEVGLAMAFPSPEPCAKSCCRCLTFLSSATVGSYSGSISLCGVLDDYSGTGTISKDTFVMSDAWASARRPCLQ